MKFEVTGLVARSSTRVVVNPNRATKKNPSWTVLGFEEFDSLPSVGDRLVAVQPDEDGDWVSTARVAEIDITHSLVYADVDWTGFSLEGSCAGSNRGSHFKATVPRVRTSSPSHFSSSFVPIAA